MNDPISQAQAKLRVHDLKIDANHFADVISGRKTFELRSNDRGFQVGDMLRLHCTRYTGLEMMHGAPLEYTGEVCERIVSHILAGHPSVKRGHVILSFEGMIRVVPHIPPGYRLIREGELTRAEEESWASTNYR